MDNTVVPIQLEWKYGGESVSVAGSFNNWTPLAMNKKDDGTFEITVEAPPGEIEFKFIVDGEWKESRDYETKLSSMNSLNNVQLVELLDSEQLDTQDRSYTAAKEANGERYDNARAPGNLEISNAVQNGLGKRNNTQHASRIEDGTSQSKLKENIVTNRENSTQDKVIESGKGWKQRCCVS